MSGTRLAILAGGRSLRMGTDKAFVEIDGRPFLDILVTVAHAVGLDAIALGPAERLDGAGVAVIEDSSTPRGPLTGLDAALGAVGSVVLVATDQPYLRPATVAALIEVGLEHPGKAIVPVDRGARQVTCALYPDAWSGLLTEFRSIQVACDALPIHEVGEDVWSTWGEDGRSWLSLDEPADIEMALGRYGAPPRW